MTERIEHIVRMLPESLAMIVSDTLRGHKIGSVVPSNLKGTEYILIMLLEELVELNSKGVENE